MSCGRKGLQGQWNSPGKVWDREEGGGHTRVGERMKISENSHENSQRSWPGSPHSEFWTSS